MIELIHSGFGAIDYTLFITLLCVSCGIGLYFGCFGNNEQTTEEYLMGGKKMKTIPIAISLIASQLSAIAIMAMPVEMYAFGPHVWLAVPMMILVGILTNYAFLPVFYNNNLDNCYAYLELRFSKQLRSLVTAVYIISTILILPVFLFVPSLAFSQATNGNIHVINSIVSAVCVFYTMLGGIKAVVWTDVIQGLIMVISIFVVAILGIIKVGGIEEVWSRGVAGNRIYLFDMTLDLTTRQTFWNISSSSIIGWCAYLSFNQSCVQRLVSVPTLKNAKTAIFIFIIGYIIIMSMNCFTGLIMYAYFYDCDPVTFQIVEKPDRLIPYFVEQVAGHISGMPGIFISCVFSASLSTISANFNSLAGIIYTDYLKRLTFIKTHTERTANLTMKFTICLLGIYCILMGFFVEQFSSIYQLVTTMIGLSHGVIFGIFTLGMLYPWANRQAALYSAIISIICVVWIISGGQYLIAKGEFHYDMLPVSLEGCPIKNGLNLTNANSIGINFNSSSPSSSSIIETTTPMTTIIQNNNSTDADFETFSIYKLAFPWYTTFGTMLIWIIGIPLSHIIGSNDNIQNINPNLISPIAQWLIPVRIDYRKPAMNDYELNVIEKGEQLNKLLQSQNVAM